MKQQETNTSTRPATSVTTAAPSLLPVPDKTGAGCFFMSNGWIKLHRNIAKHWVWDNPMYLKGWITILLEVNHEVKKVMIHNELIECDRGQSIHSLGSWVKLFGKHWSVQKVRTFFILLQKDSMIELEGLHKTTRLTVCNYDKYQDYQQADNKQITSKQQADNKQITTNKKIKNDKKIKNEKNIIYPTVQECIFYFIENGYSEEAGKKFHEYYSTGNWKDSKDKQVKNWKGKAVAVWFKDENKIKTPERQKITFPT